MSGFWIYLIRHQIVGMWGGQPVRIVHAPSRQPKYWGAFLGQGVSHAPICPVEEEREGEGGGEREREKSGCACAHMHEYIM